MKYLNLTRLLMAGTFALLSQPREANSFCFILPRAISYGCEVNSANQCKPEGQALSALNAGMSESSRRVPLVSDLMGGRVIMANIYSIDSFDVTLMVNGAPRLVTVKKGQAIRLTENKRAYVIFNVRHLNSNETVDVTTDVWASGKWIYQYSNLKVDKDGVSQSAFLGLGAYIRILTAAQPVALGGEVTAVSLGNIVRFCSQWNAQGKCSKGEFYAKTQDLPNSASEAPFSTPVFAGVKVVEDCAVTNTCGDPSRPDIKVDQPLSLQWSLKRVR